MESFDLAILFTTAGALVGATLVKTLVSAGKGLGWVPETGRGVMYTVLALSALLIALACWGADFIADGLDAQDVLIIMLSILGIYTSAIGINETAAKVQRVMSDGTDPNGPDQ